MQPTGAPYERLRRVRLGDIAIRVAEQGAGRPLLLINGIGARLETWWPLTRLLAQHRRVITFDAPGTGESATLRRPARMPELARLVVALLDDLGLDRADVLGYSWGGALAQQLARDSPDRIRRLILVSTTPGLGGRPPALVSTLAVSTPLHYVVGRHAAAVDATVFGGGTGGEARREIARWLNQPPRRPYGYASQLYAISGWTSLPWLRRIPQPTLVIGGGDDPLARAHNARLLAARIPGAVLELRPEAGHLWLLEHAQESASVIDEFLS